MFGFGGCHPPHPWTDSILLYLFFNDDLPNTISRKPIPIIHRKTVVIKKLELSEHLKIK